MCARLIVLVSTSSCCHFDPKIVWLREIPHNVSNQKNHPTKLTWTGLSCQLISEFRYVARPSTQLTKQEQKMSSSMDVDVDVPIFLAETRNRVPESLQPSILGMEDLWERRLWHQLTLELEKFFNDPESAGSRMRMFKDFVGTFEKNINQLKLVGLALLAKEECRGKALWILL